MNKTTLCQNLILLFFLGFFIFGYSQQNQDFEAKTYFPTHPGCIYTPSEFRGLISNPVSQDVANKMMGGDTPCTTFVVNYIGFTSEAQAAFQYAVDIWAASIESSVPIRITATFADLAPGTLGSASPNGFITLDPTAAPGALPNVFYPIPLADKLSGESINGIFEIDINANFNNDTNEVPWYFGIDANPGPGQFDFVSVVLHEIAHGLGFTGFGRVNALNGAIRIEPTSGPPALPSIYDNFIENGDGVDLLTFDDPSPQLGIELTSENLFSNSPIAINQNGTVLPKIFAPIGFNQGSSYSHWDEATFGPGNINSLMSPQIGPGEANHNPGPITLGFFEDMGWSICGGSLTVDEFDLASVELSPNPFSAEISVRLSNGLSDDYSIDLIDINGRIVLTKEMTAINGQINIDDLGSLTNALYFIKITNENSGASVTKKIIKN